MHHMMCTRRIALTTTYEAPILQKNPTEEPFDRPTQLSPASQEVCIYCNHAHTETSGSGRVHTVSTRRALPKFFISSYNHWNMRGLAVIDSLNETTRLFVTPRQWQSGGYYKTCNPCGKAFVDPALDVLCRTRSSLSPLVVLTWSPLWTPGLTVKPFMAFIARCTLY